MQQMLTGVLRPVCVEAVSLLVEGHFILDYMPKQKAVLMKGPGAENSAPRTWPQT